LTRCEQTVGWSRQALVPTAVFEEGKIDAGDTEDLVACC
jgi:hypothetical protein